jgi:hypothetical protein
LILQPGEVNPVIETVATKVSVATLALDTLLHASFCLAWLGGVDLATLGRQFQNVNAFVIKRVPLRLAHAIASHF